jgi:hypothetical protein
MRRPCIESVEGMASADIIEMMLSTKFPPHRIIDWIDEALLRLCLPPIIGKAGEQTPHPLSEQLAKYGIRTATGLVSVYYASIRPAPLLAQPPLGHETLQSLHPIITEVMLQPNFRHVADWKRIPETIFEDLDARITGGVRRDEGRLSDRAVGPIVEPGLARRIAKVRKAAANGEGAAAAR